jgi:hypothetical protein
LKLSGILSMLTDESNVEAVSELVNKVELDDLDDDNHEPASAASVCDNPTSIDSAAVDVDVASDMERATRQDAASGTTETTATSRIAPSGLAHAPSGLAHAPSGLAHVLKTGQFDAADIKLLRTCSEPDLSRLSRRPSEVAAIGSSRDVRDRRADSEADADHAENYEAVKLEWMNECDSFDVALISDTIHYSLHIDEIIM